MERKRLRVEQAFAIAARRADGASIEEIGREFNIKQSLVKERLRGTESLSEAVKALETEPTHIAALERLALVPDLDCTAYYLEKYGVTTLHQLAEQGWSRAEVAAAYSHATSRHLDRLESVMAQFGLKLHPDREKPLERPVTDEEEARRDGIWDMENDWAKTKDREFIIEQARLVAWATRDIWQTLNDAVDDPRYYRKAARFLQNMPNKVNPMVEEGERLEGAAASLGEALEARSTASRRVAKLAVARATGNVVAFPAHGRPS
jgi:hypothetical protein